MWRLQVPAVLFCHERRPRKATLSHAFCVPRSCQVGALLSLQQHWCLHPQLTLALQPFSTAVNPNRKRCAGRIAVLDRAAELIERSITALKLLAQGP